MYSIPDVSIYFSLPCFSAKHKIDKQRIILSTFCRLHLLFLEAYHIQIMDFIPIQSPLAPEVMDTMLSYGYYRMQQNLFTVDYAHTDDRQRVRVIWARVCLKDFIPNHRHLKLAKRCRHLHISLHCATITDEIEDLYTAYRAAIDFDGNDSVTSCLTGDRNATDYFPGRMWQIHDGDKLVAVGYFDEGKESCAGILNFFHPDYAKYSLGLWMYLEGVRYAAETGKRFYYPGYIAMGFAKFDYKLLAGRERVQLWDPAKAEWIPYESSIHARQHFVSAASARARYVFEY
jgi:arginine-tRNA-protein transferase